MECSVCGVPGKSSPADLVSKAVRQVLARLEALGLVNDQTRSAARTTLSALISDAADAGERNEENLILFAMGRFHI